MEQASLQPPLDMDPRLLTLDMDPRLLTPHGRAMYLRSFLRDRAAADAAGADTELDVYDVYEHDEEAKVTKYPDLDGDLWLDGYPFPPPPITRSPAEFDDIEGQLETDAQLLDLQRRLAAYMDDLDDIPMEDEDGFFMDLDLMPLRSLQSEPSYPHGELVRCECEICFDTVQLRKRVCCDFPVCDRCMIQYLETQVNQGIVKVPCVSGICEAFVYRDEILGRLSSTMKDRYYKFLVDANKNPKIKTCPRCSHIYNLEELGSINHEKYGVLVKCPECQLDWCFECHSPWHDQVKCREYRKGDKLLKNWAKEHHYGHNNAQKCPKCKIFIERKGGCDHMICSQCNTSFCYRCGERFLEVKFFGNHLSRLSPLGCKYNFKPDKPVARKLIRGSVFSATVLGGIGLLGVGVAAVGVLIGASVFILPAAVGYKYHKYRKRKKHIKQQQELFRMRTKNALMELHRERAVLQALRVSRLNSGENANETVHVGIQTGQSQEVNVMVHNPYHSDATTVPAQPINSEVSITEKDDQGQVTVTTAEIKQNTATEGGDGAEAAMVLHVKTTYSKPSAKTETETEVDESYKGVFDALFVSLMDTNTHAPTVTNEVFHDEAGAKPVPQEKNAGSQRAGAKASSEGSNSLTRHSSKSSKHSASSKTIDSENVRRSEHRKCKHGSLSKNGSLSNKHRKGNVSSKNSETGLQTSQTVPDLGQGEESFRKTEVGNSETGTSETQQNESLSQSGCFMKLFSKKLNNLHSQFDKEKEKQTLTNSVSEGKDKEILDCPDIVSCAVESEMKNAESVRDDQGTGQDKTEVDKFLGLVAKETFTTQL